MTPESIISASDEELLTIPGVGISFVKKLRETLGGVWFYQKLVNNYFIFRELKKI